MLRVLDFIGICRSLHPLFHFSGDFVLNFGQLSQVDNAEKLVDELKAKGIAAKTETRIQLGPFTTRTEAEVAMARLRALGYTPLLIPLGQ